MKKILITGGTRGIGASVAKELKKNGFECFVTYQSNDLAAQEFEKNYGIKTHKVNVNNYDTCQELFEKTGPIYGIVHNAGITRDAFFHKMALDEWQDVLNTNLGSCFNVIRPYIENMRQAGAGRIILLSSINGLKGQMGQTNYCASKAGLIGFAKSLAQENANKGITVNVVAPGYIETDMVRAIDSAIADKIRSQIPVGRMGQPEEIAKAILYLMSPDANFITGETLNINGGQFMH